jgi:hypothetical protein
VHLHDAPHCPSNLPTCVDSYFAKEKNCKVVAIVCYTDDTV